MNYIKKQEKDLEFEKSKDSDYYLKEKYYLDNGIDEETTEKVMRLDNNWRNNIHSKNMSIYFIGLFATSFLFYFHMGSMFVISSVEKLSKGPVQYLGDGIIFLLLAMLVIFFLLEYKEFKLHKEHQENLLRGDEE